MANLVNLEAVRKSYGQRHLLDAVSLGIAEGDRIGVVGLNGGGKTTLLEVLAGIEPPDSGRVSQARGLRMAVVTQRTELPHGSTVREAALADYQAEHEWAANPRARSIVEGLGLTSVGLDVETGQLSGGERRRVALAAALVGELDLIVLDEPTNHLDVEGVRWLAEHLLARRVAVVVVTHDRWFLDTVCGRIWEVVDGGVAQYEGGYADWVYARAERERLAASAEQKRRNLARKELAWLQRGAKARTSKPRYRVEAAQALIADVPEPRDSVQLRAFARRRLGKTVVELEDVWLTAGETPLLADVTWRIGPGDRIGLVGVNGSGKTTLLQLLADELPPQSGNRVQGKTVRLAHLTQELEDLPTRHPAAASTGGTRRGGTAVRVVEAIDQVASTVTLGNQELSASQVAQRLGFAPGRQQTPVEDLSGGERRRLQLVRLLMSEPNVLLLDEPTNDLDIDTLQQLEDLLDSWPGTLVVVSHDRYLIERVCDTVIALLGDGKITHLPGGIEEYLAHQHTHPTWTQPDASASADNRRGGGNAKTDAARWRAASKELGKLERRMDALHDKESQLHEALAEAATDPARLSQLNSELAGVVAERKEVEDRWLEVSELVE